MAASALLLDTDILIDYLKSIQPACVLLDSTQFDFYYSSWTRKELLAKPGLKESERQEIEFARHASASRHGNRGVGGFRLLRSFRVVPHMLRLDDIYATSRHRMGTLLQSLLSHAKNSILARVNECLFPD